jgi:WD40 repeat protein
MDPIMTGRYPVSACLLLLSTCTAGRTAEAIPPPPDRDPILRVEAGGPTAFVTALAFSADGKTLYAAGFDKVVRVWTLDETTQRFTLSSTAYRVPTAPGSGGVINAIALSPDGTWLAVAGRMVFRGETDYRATGYVLPTVGALDADRRLDVGTIYTFHTKTHAVRALRGHQGPVLALAFAPARAGKPPILASAGQEEGSPATGSVRLWNLDPNAQDPVLAKFPGSLPNPYHADRDAMTRPGLALWHTGPGLRQMDVAVAWEDSRFRLWDVAQNDIPPKSQPFYNNTAVYLPGQNAVLTAYSNKSPEGHFAGYLRTWALNNQRDLTSLDPVKLPNDAFPRALAALSWKANGQIDGAAVVLQIPADRSRSGQLEYVLQLLDVQGFRTITTVPLWAGTADLPVLATAPSGRYLAVAGNPNHTIRLYALADLLQNKTAPHQELRSAGTIMRSVAFVKNGKERGLLLNEQPAGAGGLVYDFAKRTLTDNLQGWQSDTTRSAGADAKQLVRKLGLKAAPEQVVSAFLPAGTLLKVPVLAVAVSNNVETRLGLYNAASGEQLRQLSGHVNAILALDFSGDGKLLASASEDQTVNVWSLTDLDKALGQEGQLRGVYVREKKAGPKGVLELAEPDQARLLPDNQRVLTAKGVKQEDILEGLVEGRNLRPLRSEDEFYQAMRRLAPGKRVTLRIAGKGDVALTLSQGIDERKPLFSLFVTVDRRLKKWDWVGWSPVGPYDSSDRTVERLIGWHENKGTIEKPAIRFSLAQEYRRSYFKPGILKDLLDYGNPGQALDAWNRRLRQTREAHLFLNILAAGQVLRPDAHGRLVVTQPQATATLSLDQLPPDEVRSVEWHWNGQHGQFKPVGDREWAADLASFPWKRGTHILRAEVHTGGPTAEVYSRQVTLLYQPPPPTVDVAGNLPRFVDKPAYEVTARITPANGQMAMVKLEQRQGGQLVGKPESVEAKAKTEIRRTFQLKPGPNVIKVVATNKEAPSETAAVENAWRVVEVTYQAPEPQISLAAIVLPDGTKIAIDPATPDAPIGVDEPKVRITGTITAQEPLVLARWVQDSAVAKDLDQFRANQKPRQLDINQPITLAEPGKPQKIRVGAQAANSKQAERRLTLMYQPKLPRVEIQAPAPETVIRQAGDSAQVPLRALLTWPNDRHPCQAEILVNGKSQGPPQAIGVKQEQLQADLNLEPGNNETQVVLQNAWHRFTTPPTLVIFRSLPQVIAFTQGPVANKPPRVTLNATVATANTRPLTRVEVHSWKASAEGLPPTRVEMSIRAIPRAAWKPQQGPRRTTWSIVAEDIPLAEGTNFLRLVAGNQDGDAPEIKPLQLVYQKPVEPKARVQILEPATNTVVLSSRLRVHFGVQSQSPLTHVELVREGEGPHDREVLVTLPGMGQPALGLAVDQALEITLKRGLNTLYLIATNEGGEAISTPVVVNYQSVPLVRISLGRLEAGDQKYEAQGEPRAGIVRFPSLPQGQARLFGHVTWDAESDQLIQDIGYVRVFVNGHQLLPVTLEPPVGGQRRREFKVEIALNLAQGNLINVRLPSSRVVLEAGSHRGLVVACRAPVPPRAFAHLLILSQEKENDEAVRRHVLESLRATTQGEDRFTMPGFSEGGRIYGPLIGEELTLPSLNWQINRIRQQLRRRAQLGSANDVVMIYFRGAETLAGRDQLLQTGPVGAAAPALPPGVSFTYLADFFAKNQGAQIWLLDVTHPFADAVATVDAAVTGNGEPNLAVWRYTWTGPPSNQKPDARLITNLRPALAQSQTLGQVRELLGAKFARPPGEKLPWESLSYPKKLLYDFYMAPGLMAWPIQP